MVVCEHVPPDLLEKPESFDLTMAPLLRKQPASPSPGSMVSASVNTEKFLFSLLRLPGNGRSLMG